MYTPKTLRELIRKLTYEGGDPLRDEGNAHADAWEGEHETRLSAERSISMLADMASKSQARETELLKALRECARLSDRLGVKLAAKVQPGHADYISKADAALVATAAAEAARAAIKKAEGG
jgi:hypothetical protein